MEVLAFARELALVRVVRFCRVFHKYGMCCEALKPSQFACEFVVKILRCGHAPPVQRPAVALMDIPQSPDGTSRDPRTHSRDLT